MPTASDRGDIVFDGVSYNIDTNQLRINFKLPLGIYLADIVPENGNKGYIHIQKYIGIGTRYMDSV